MSWLKKKLGLGSTLSDTKFKIWHSVAPPLRVFRCTRGILLVTGNYDVDRGILHRLWLYDGKHFRPADSPQDDFYDDIFIMYPDHFEELTRNSWLYPTQSSPKKQEEE